MFDAQLSTVKEKIQIELRSGYKKIEMGIIPDDWEIKYLGELATLRTGPFGSALHKSDYILDGVPVINPMHIVDGQVVPTRTMTITNIAAKHLSEFQLCLGDIIMGRRGDMGRCAVIGAEQVGWICGTGSLIIRSNAEIVPDFLQRVLSSPSIIALIEEASVGSTMINLNQKVLQGLSIQVPPLEEQRIISSALCDIDHLINSLDKLIAKKRDIKQGAMQELLTGKRRLPGFTTEWEVKIIGEIFQFLPTANNSRSDMSDQGEIKYLHYGDIHTKWKSFVDCGVDDLPRIHKSKVRNIPLLEDGDLVMADASEDYDGIGISVEANNATGRNVVAGLHTLLLRGNKGVLADGFKGYLQYIPDFRAALMRIATGISVYGISKGNIKDISILLPPVSEQQAIAKIISDMDAEITTLERKREKTRALKQGMMQELLTGRTRLV